MLEYLSDSIKQVVYKHYRFRDNPYFQLFYKIYMADSSFFKTVEYIETENNFLLYNFEHPSLNKYQTKEIAVFNSYQFTIYWLPGIKSRAQGELKNNIDNISLCNLILSRPLNLNISIVQNKLHIIKRSHSNNAKNLHKLKGCFLPYKFLELELKHLALGWLSDPTNIQHQDIVMYATDLHDNDIKQKLLSVMKQFRHGNRPSWK